MGINEAVILLGGMGTRLLPYTKTVPKEMLPIYDVPNIFLLVKEAYNSGIKKIIFVVTEHNKKIIQDFFTHDDYLEEFLKDKKDKKELLQEVEKIINEIEFKYVMQNMKGTYGALYSAKDYIEHDNFIVMYGDDLFASYEPVSKILIDKAKIDHQMYVTIRKRNYEDLPKVGVATIDKYNYLINLVPKETVKEGFELTGRMLLNKKIFNIKDQLVKHANDEYYLSYALLKFPNEVKVLIYDLPYFNIGEKSGYIKASIFYALEKKDDDLLKYIKELK